MVSGARALLSSPSAGGREAVGLSSRQCAAEEKGRRASREAGARRVQEEHEVHMTNSAGILKELTQRGATSRARIKARRDLGPGRAVDIPRSCSEPDASDS